MNHSSNKLHIVYPGGAGGNWLGYLIYLLQGNPISDSNNPINFHTHPHSDSVVLSHWPLDNNNYWKIFSSSPTYNFNLYIQGYVKNRIFETPWTESTFVGQFNETIYNAAYKFSAEWYRDYHQNVDLHYDLIFTNPDEFCNELFSLLDQSQVFYTPDKKIVFDAINYFKKTLPNPLDHLDNLDSFFWLGWCFGIMHHENMPGNIDYQNCTKEDLINSILPRRQYFADYTKPYVTVTGS